VNDLQMKHEKLVNSHTRLSKDHKTAVDKLSETEKELVAARYRPPTKQTEVQTDQIEPEIVLVEQPPSQETLAEIAEKVRAELVHLSSLFPVSCAPPRPCLSWLLFASRCGYTLINEEGAAERSYRKAQGAKRLPGEKR